MLNIEIGAAVATGLITVASYATFVPSSRIWGDVIWRGTSEGPPRVALTFDDGPTAGTTDRILDLLGEMNVKSSFFVIGRNVEREPDLLKRIDAEGHLVGNHTYDHDRLCSFGHPRFWRTQIDKTDAAIERVLGKKPLLIRPPIGHKNPFAMRVIRKSGHKIVTWGVRGWDGLASITSTKMIEHVVPRCTAGTIVILHDGVEPNRIIDRSATIAAVKPLIIALRAKGLEPVRVDELTGLRAYA